jgi:hypothetical protein
MWSIVFYIYLLIIGLLLKRAETIDTAIITIIASYCLIIMGFCGLQKTIDESFRH